MGKSYQDLRVWHSARELAGATYRLTKKLPKEETYGLTSQIRRSAVSVASNIAEGAGRNNTKEFIQFLGIASGSLAELHTQILITLDVELLMDSDVEPLLALIDDVSRMISGLKRSLREKS